MLRKLEMDMTQGPLLKKIIIYAIPLILTNVLQLLFNAADVMIVGVFSGDDAVAAVGANSALIKLITALFIGLSVGSNVMVARYIGKKDAEKVSRFVGMSVLVSVLVGVVLLVVGVFFARTFLVWMACDPDVLDMATKYLAIYLMGMPVVMLYNFCASILRAAGDTVRPLIFLVIAGVVNVGLNVFFCTVCKMDVDGVAIATVASQAISAVLCMIVLIRHNGIIKLRAKNLKIYWKELGEMAYIGIPSGIHSCMFAFSNVIVQSTINSFGKLVMAGNAYAQQIEGFVLQANNGVALTALSFASQNLGAGKLDRVKKSVLISVAVVAIMSLVLGGIVMLFSKSFLALFANDTAVIEAGVLRISILLSTVFLGGIMDTSSYAMRGMGKSVSVIIVSLLVSCVFRICWVKLIFPMQPTLGFLYVSYPISWFLGSVVYAAMFAVFMRKLLKNGNTQIVSKEEKSLPIKNDEVDEREVIE